MEHHLSRTEMILGAEAIKKLNRAKVAVFGLGGVGAAAAEALARSGIGRMVLVDFDVVEITNLNRQVIALRSTLGRPKTAVMAERIRDIDPDISVEEHRVFYGPENAALLSPDLSYIIDAIDTVSSKIDLIVRAGELGIPIISAMGTGNKLDPSRLELADIYDTSVCPLARVVRRELRKRGVRSLPVVYSREEALPFPGETVPEPGEAAAEAERAGEEQASRHIPGSSAFVPPSAGLIMASRVVRDLAGLSL